MKSGDFFELLFFLIIAAITIVGKIIQSQTKKNERAGKRNIWSDTDTNDDWEPWQPESSASRQLENTFDPKPVSKPETKPINYARIDTKKPFNEEASTYQTVDNRTINHAQTNNDSISNDFQYAMTADGNINQAAMWKMHKSMALAIPRAKKMNRNATGKTRSIKLVLNDRKDLRRAVLKCWDNHAHSTCEHPI